MWNGLMKRQTNEALKNKEVLNFGQQLIAA
jgi:hypothetical protein